jgi:hypothetical protein
VRGGNQGFDEQPIERLGADLGEVQPGQVDLSVPSRQKSVIDLELCAQFRANGQSGSAGAAHEALLKLAAAHVRVADGISLLRKTPRTATAAGVIPGIRAA